ncbi:MAG: type II toxin-antitoxin system VapC family toxin [Terracidiphilus sp.]
MSRIYWDSMLFIYLLEGHATFSARAQQLLDRSYHREDTLFTSYLALGEVMAGAEKSPYSVKAQEMRNTITEMGFSFLPFGSGAVEAFVLLRTKEKLKIADSIHLACAASAGIDLFLTGDKQLARLDIPGIQFIADFNNPVL